MLLVLLAGFSTIGREAVAAPSEKAVGEPLGLRKIHWQGQVRSAPGDPGTAARRFFVEYSGLLAPQIDALSWQVARVRRSSGSTVVDLRREVAGLPVYGEQLRVILSREGIVHSVVGQVGGSAASLRNRIVLTEGEATAIAKRAWGAQKLISGAPKPWMAAFERPSGWRAVWVVALPSEVPAGDGRILVDAETGEVLRVADISARHSGETTTAKAWVFRPDPLTTAHAAYGDMGFIDGDDADTPQLDGQRVTVLLDSLTVSSGTLHLKGAYVWVRDLIGIEALPATVQLGDSFAYNRSESGFEDVMAYYHLDAFQRRLQTLGFEDLQRVPIQVDAHAFSADNSQYYPDSNRVYFGEGGIDDAEDADVIIHEYGHALMYDAVFSVSKDSVVSSEFGWDMRCLAEGFCDYLAGSYSQTEENFGSDSVFNWDGNNPEIGWYGRPLQTEDSYNDWIPADTLSSGLYLNGTIWADALWRARETVGADTADRVAIESLYYLSPSLDIDEAAQQVLQAARDLYEDTHIASIFEQAFAAKGFLTAVSAPETRIASLPQRFEVESPYPNPFNPSTSLLLHLPNTATVTLRVWNVSGRLIESRALGTLSPGSHRVVWRAGRDVASGVVLLELNAGSHGRVLRKAILLR